MNYFELFTELKKEFDEETSLNVTIANAINILYVPSKKDFLIKDRYGKRLEKKIHKVLWEVQNIEEVLSIQSVVHSWGVSRSMDGLGGCKVKTFKQLLEEKDERKS